MQTFAQVDRDVEEQHMLILTESSANHQSDRLRRRVVSYSSLLGFLLAGVACYMVWQRSDSATTAQADASASHIINLAEDDATFQEELSAVGGFVIPVAIKSFYGNFCGDVPNSGIICRDRFAEPLQLVYLGEGATGFALRSPSSKMFCGNKGRWVGCDFPTAKGVDETLVRLKSIRDDTVAIQLGHSMCSAGRKHAAPSYGKLVCDGPDRGILEEFQIVVVAMPQSLQGIPLPIAIRSEASGEQFCHATKENPALTCSGLDLEDGEGLHLVDSRSSMGKFALQSQESGTYCSTVGPVRCATAERSPTTDFKFEQFENKLGTFRLKGDGEMSKYCADIQGSVFCDRFSPSGSTAFWLSIVQEPDWTAIPANPSSNATSLSVFAAIYAERSNEPSWNQIYASYSDGGDDDLPGLKALAASLLDSKATRPLVVFVTSEPSQRLKEASMCLNFSFVQRPPLAIGSSARLDKLNAWTLPAQKVVYLDPTAVVLRNVDVLFDCAHDFCAAPDVSASQAWNKFDIGVMVLQPSMAMFEQMWQQTTGFINAHHLGRYEQYFLNAFVGSKWTADAVLETRFNTPKNLELQGSFDLASVSVIRNTDGLPWGETVNHEYPISHGAFWDAFSSSQQRCDESSVLVALRSYRTGKICADQIGGIQCNFDEIGHDAVFAMVTMDSGETRKFALRSDRTGHYCNPYLSGVRCGFDSEHAAQYQMWDKDWGLFSFSVDSTSPKYCSDDNGVFVCNRDEAVQSEWFQVVVVKAGGAGPQSPVAFSSGWTNNFCESTSSGLNCNQNKIGLGKSTRFDVLGAGYGKHGTYIRNLGSEKYCTNANGGINCESEEPQLFNLKAIGFGKFSLQVAQTQKYCSAWRRSANCNREFADKWENWELVLAGLPYSREERIRQTHDKSGISLHNADRLGITSATVNGFDSSTRKYNVEATDRVLRFPDLDLVDQVDPEFVRWSDMCTDPVLKGPPLQASRVCPSYLYEKPSSTFTNLPRELKSRTEQVLSNLQLTFVSSSNALSSNHTDARRARHFLKAWDVLKRLSYLAAEDVFAFAETWNHEDTEMLARMDNHTNVWVDDGELNTNSFGQQLLGVDTFKDTLMGQSLAIVTARGNSSDADADYSDVYSHGSVNATTHDGQRAVTEFRMDFQAPWKAYCEFFHNAPGRVERALMLRPTAICALGDDLAGFSKSFLFWWFVGRRQTKLDLYGLKSAPTAESSNGALDLRLFEYHFFNEWSRLDSQTTIRS